MKLRAVVGDAARLWFYYPYRWVINALPLRAAFRFSRLGAKLWAMIKGAKARDRIQANMKRGLGGVLPDGGSDRWAELYVDFLQTHILVRTGLLLYPSLARRPLDSFFRVNHSERLDRALDEGKGAIFTTAHMGPSMLATFWCGRRYETGLLRLLHDKNLSTPGARHVLGLTRRMEELLPVRYMDVAGDLSGRERLLQNNGVLVQTGDGSGVLSGGGRFEGLAFLKQTVLFPRGPFSLAWRTGAPVVPYFLSCGRDRFELSVEEPIWCRGEAGEKEAVIRRAMEAFAQVFEQHLVKNPGTWQLWEIFEEGKLLRSGQSRSDRLKSN